MSIIYDKHYEYNYEMVCTCWTVHKWSLETHSRICRSFVLSSKFDQRFCPRRLNRGGQHFRKDKGTLFHLNITSQTRMLIYVRPVFLFVYKVNIVHGNHSQRERLVNVKLFGI